MNVILFIFGVIGLTHIAVDSEISKPIYEWIKPRLPIAARVMDCYQCAGFWCGLVLGLIVLTDNLLVVLAAGCAGSFLAQLGWLVLDTLEAYIRSKK